MFYDNWGLIIKRKDILVQEGSWFIYLKWDILKVISARCNHDVEAVIEKQQNVLAP